MPALVLIIEDDQAIRESLKEALNLFGLRCELAANGQEALEVLARVERPSLILLDLMMPIMNGPEFRVQQMTDSRIANIPVVVLTADGKAQQKASEIGAVACLNKPIDLEILISTVHRYAVL